MEPLYLGMNEARRFLWRMGWIRTMNGGHEIWHDGEKGSYTLRGGAQKAMRTKEDKPNLRVQIIDQVQKTNRPGRNVNCPCGSSKKWKHCHGSPGGGERITKRSKDASSTSDAKHANGVVRED